MKSLLLAWLLAVDAWAQALGGPVPERLIWPSRYLSAPLQAEVHLPAGYSAAPNQRYPLCLLLHGGGGSALELRSLGLAELATRHQVIIVAPDAGSALFVDPADAGGEQMESAVIRDLLPELGRRYRTLGTRQGRLVVGLSFGGYAALRLGILYPDLFSMAASLSGVVEAPSWSASEEALLPPRIRNTMVRAFGPAGTEARHRKDLFVLLEAMPPEARRSLPFLALECGTEDLFLRANQRLATRLQSLGILHEWHPSPGKHDGAFWRRQLAEVLCHGVQRIENRE